MTGFASTIYKAALLGKLNRIAWKCIIDGP
jgi:hypothetical protein